MGLQVICVIGFLPANFQLAMHFSSRLRVRYRIDGQTAISHQWLMPLPYVGRGIINAMVKFSIVLCTTVLLLKQNMVAYEF